MSYAVKYASGLLRAVPRGSRLRPAFGDRRAYQMDPANAGRPSAKPPWTWRREPTS